MACAALTASVVHAHLFSAPPGELVGTSTSPDNRWEVRKAAIWPPPGASFAWRIDVRSLERSDSSWRTVYLGPAGKPPLRGVPVWSDANTITVAGRSVDVRGEGYQAGWMSAGEAIVAELLTLGAGLLVLAGGVAVTWLVARRVRRGS